MKKIILLATAFLGIGLFTLSAFAESMHCTISGALPDATCTPGAVFPGATKKIVCKAGYTKTVRSVSTATQKAVYASYGVTKHSASTYEVDHFIPLELGGSNDIKNLWPEAATPKPGFHEKDAVENYLHKQVCASAMTLEEAQKTISTNWQTVQMPSPKAANKKSSSQAPSCPIKGNITSKGEKVYHLPTGCPSYNSTVIEATKGERWFCTESEAIAAGWKKAGNCRRSLSKLNSQ